MADYAFVPGGTSFELAAQLYLGLRLHTGGVLMTNIDTGDQLETFRERLVRLAVYVAGRISCDVPARRNRRCSRCQRSR